MWCSRGYRASAPPPSPIKLKVGIPRKTVPPSYPVPFKNIRPKSHLKIYIGEGDDVLAAIVRIRGADATRNGRSTSLSTLH